MVRLAFVLLSVLSIPAAAWSAPASAPADSELMRSFQLLRSAEQQRFVPAGTIGRTEIGPNAQFGFGMFGLKAEKTHLQPVTGREIDAPKQRRAAVGFLLKF